MAVLKENAYLSADEIVNSVVEALNVFVKTQELDDDATMVVIKSK